MARVEIATQPWGVVQDRAGNVRAGLTFTLTTTVGGAVTRYTTAAGGTTDTASVTNTNGEIPGFVEDGTYTLSVGGRTVRVEALSALTADDSNIAIIKEAPLNVQYPEYGAVGDGTADDTTEIQAAINVAAVAGGEVLIPPGVFRHASLDLKSNVTLRGVGRGSVLKQVNAGGPIRNEHYTGNGVNVDTGITIRDLDIDGNRTAVPVGNNFGLILANTTGFLIDNVRMRSCYRTCLRLGGDATVNGSADRGTVRHCHFTDAGGVDGLGGAYGVGLSIIRGSRIDMDGCFFYFNETHGFDAEPNAVATVLENINLRGCFAYSNSQGGFTAYNASASQDTEAVRNVTFDACTAYSNGHDGFRVFGWRKAWLTACHSYSNTMDGLRVDNYNSGLRVLDSEFRSNSGSGIRFTSQVTPLAVIRGCSMRANTGWGVTNEAARTTFWLDLIDNHLLGNTAGNISLTAPSTNGRVVQRDNFTAASDAPTGLGPSW